MNYYNPYFSVPYQSANMMSRGGIFSRLFGKFNFSSILNGTQKTLNIVNQTIPLVKQAKPLIKNAKTMFKVMNEFKKTDKISSTDIKTIQNEEKNQDICPTFFI